MSTTIDDRIARARLSLEGLSVGDAFGQTFFTDPNLVERMIAERHLAEGPWRYTDDTAMALSVFEVLREHGGIDQDRLALSFAETYDITRGFGAMMHSLLPAFGAGGNWAELAPALFEGQGSFGNGAAMRVAPLGAYFADDPARAAEEAARSAVVTHAHDEGIAGAIAVAIAAAYAWRLGRSAETPSRAEFLEMLLPHLPESEVRSRIRQARDMSPVTSVDFAVAVLGNGLGVSAQDTVPFALWCAAEHLDDYEKALWLTVSGLGDRDTTCAITGGVVALHTGIDGIPTHWLAAREPLPARFTGEDEERMGG